MARDCDENGDKRIVVEDGGPYRVYGNVPLVRKTQIVSEYGEPLTWQKGETLAKQSIYALCRCGQSKGKPFCDGTHCETDFDGTETADVRPTAARRRTLPGGKQIIVRSDAPLCMESGFCRNRQTGIEKMAPETDDINVRSQVIAMIERCPSGSLTYALETAPQEDIEPDLPREIAVTTEIASRGAIQGPLWVTGAIPIERADGEPFEARNRVTLCRCGRSQAKPLCDGTHRPKD
jgi:CDGSH-type Zn-finger protein